MSRTPVRIGCAVTVGSGRVRAGPDPLGARGRRLSCPAALDARADVAGGSAAKAVRRARCDQKDAHFAAAEAGHPLLPHG